MTTPALPARIAADTGNPLAPAPAGILCAIEGCHRRRKYVNGIGNRQFIFCRRHVDEARAANQPTPEIDMNPLTTTR